MRGRFWAPACHLSLADPLAVVTSEGGHSFYGFSRSGTTGDQQHSLYSGLPGSTAKDAGGVLGLCGAVGVNKQCLVQVCSSGKYA